MLREIKGGKIPKCKHPYPWDHLDGQWYRCFKCKAIFSNQPWRPAKMEEEEEYAGRKQAIIPTQISGTAWPFEDE